MKYRKSSSYTIYREIKRAGSRALMADENLEFGSRNEEDE